MFDDKPAAPLKTDRPDVRCPSGIAIHGAALRRQLRAERPHRLWTMIGRAAIPPLWSIISPSIIYI
jgi:hypothetical protein